MMIFKPGLVSGRTGAAAVGISSAQLSHKSFVKWKIVVGEFHPEGPMGEFWTNLRKPLNHSVPLHKGRERNCKNKFKFHWWLSEVGAGWNRERIYSIS